ncbi:hypothetical protein [Rufibacter roseus]|uniref:Uncharacterized protein n=1 Tax=Rufibacter roseus TaxID=1567108 RepID=A0ABW2DT24_9BACT|nr:hypothetical protein [Rufibacter roseus]
MKLNTKFVLKLDSTDSDNYSFTLKSQEAFNEEVQVSSAAALFSKKVADDEIEGIFTYGKFGDRQSIFLILKSGLKVPINYDLKIKTDKNKELVKTSVVTLFPNVPSNELWPYHIDLVSFSNFRKLSE